MKLVLGLGVSYGFRYQAAAAYYFWHLRVLTTNITSTKLCWVCIYVHSELIIWTGQGGVLASAQRVCYNMSEEWYWFAPLLVSLSCMYLPLSSLLPFPLLLEYFLGARYLGNSRKKKQTDSCSDSILINVKAQMQFHNW